MKVMNICEHPLCTNLGMECEVPYDPVGKDPEYEYYCAIHAFEHGYCYMCGQFWGGCESFDFSPSHLCPNCQEEESRDDWEDDFGLDVEDTDED